LDDICGAMIQLDTSGKITAWNQTAENILGFNESEILGTNVLSEIFISEADAGMLETALSGEVYYSFESYAKNSDGDMQPVAIVTSPISEETTGEIIGATVLVSNILLI